MSTFEVSLLRRERVAEGVMAFSFSKPAGYAYRAGQSLRMTLIDPPETDRRGDARTFNLVSAPGDAELTIATRLRDSAFKRVLQSAPVGTRLRIGEAGGGLALHRNPARAAVLLADGIGVTPFVSIARHAARESLPHAIHLFYSAPHPAAAPFLTELQHLQRVNPNYHLVTTMTEAGALASDWHGERGPIDWSLLKQHLPADLVNPCYYLAGAPSTATALFEMLEDGGVGSECIKSSEFHGY